MIEVKLDELARKVEKHNGMIERQYALEKKVALIESEVEQMRKAV